MRVSEWIAVRLRRAVLQARPSSEPKDRSKPVESAVQSPDPGFELIEQHIKANRVQILMDNALNAANENALNSLLKKR